MGQGNKGLKKSLSQSTRERWENDCGIKEKLQQDLPLQARRSSLLFCLIIVLGSVLGGWKSPTSLVLTPGSWAQQASVQFSSVAQSCPLFVTPWTAAHQASLSITTSQSLHKLMSIKSVMPSNHLILCRPLLLLPSIFPSIRVFPVSQLFASGGQSIGVSAAASVLPMNTQDWSPSGWASWISSWFKGLSRVFSNTTVQKHQFFGAQLSL